MKLTPIRCVLLLLMLCLAVPAWAAETVVGPRPGKYRILSYGAPGSGPLHLGYFELASKTYKAFLPGDKMSGTGDWQFDAPSSTVIWKTGPYAGVWDGKFSVDRGGKTHTIRLKRTTIGTNSTE